MTADKVLCDVLIVESAKEIADDIADVFGDCTADETYLMLAVAEKLKQTLRLKKYRLD